MSDSDDADLPDLETLARRYLDLWQDQWAALAADPDTAESLARLFQIWGQVFAAYNPFGRPPGPGGPGAGLGGPGAWPAAGVGAGVGAGAAGGGQAMCGLVSVCPFGGAAGAPGPEATASAAEAAGDPAATRERTESNAADASAAPGSTSARPASGDGSEHVAQLLGRIAYLEKRVVALEAGAARPRFRARKGRPQD